MAEIKEREECPNIEVNDIDCNCEADCERHGVCCACIEAHRQLGNLPACLA
ncbi:MULTISPECIES: hypothetical protein [unclassified Candidatus Frackibacter]|uniref:hypothetical protein n=1 Tax=unclassified Candidatus Frackibacter TaxID=2648818 RepID=UPI000799D5C7|nr:MULTISPECIES: hypothetical protein [unclassified Candidatus Frackibacter]KXS41685.1 MAG: hypothetical protein AWU54_1555 [Candidatus Frackibacter sp. T328-2]SDB97582.1 hypothetical protein SAMN04515661_10198 [Candidatus Frackibacter sp. WG11]SEM29276.1 hypothetical protein SAMN04488698_10199 [Candidatus Frackibacter sp. WG12]SFL34152.1 hypothetical protein SAMN04488699_101100 [Candidatus Frackibacter sp. WG13]